MHIVVEYTPNPRTRMFLPGAKVSTVSRKWERSDGGDTELVRALFSIEGVAAVLANEDAIAVTVDDESLWTAIKPAATGVIAEHVAAFVAHSFEDAPEDGGDYDEKDREVVQKIKDLISSHIRPAVARDGGDIVFRSFRKGVLALDMRGACSGCPSSAVTLKIGVKNLMGYFVPEVKEIVEA